MNYHGLGNRSPKRILFVLDHFYPYVGGNETLFWVLSRSLARAGYHVAVVTLREPGTKAHEVIDGVEIHRVTTPPWAQRYLFILWAIPMVLRKARSADVVHASVYASAFPAWIAAALRGKPSVLTVHEVFGSQWQELTEVGRLVGWAFRLYEWFVLHLPFTHYVCVSKFTQSRLERFAGVVPARASVVYNSLDYMFWNREHFQPRQLRAELAIGQDAFVYLFFGRPGVSKGVEFLVEAAARVWRELPDSRLVMLLARQPADGYYRVLERISQLRLERHVSVLEPVRREELPGYLLAADCVVVPSISEGFGYSALEAATLGCPVVATAGHAVEEVLDGYADLVPPADADALSDALIRIAKTKPPPKHLPRRYDVESHVAGIASIYEKVAPRSLGGS